MDLESGKRSKRGVGAKAARARLPRRRGRARRQQRRRRPAPRRDSAPGQWGRADSTSPGRSGPGTTVPDEIVVSRGELVEIGAGFRLPDLMVTTGARLREVGTTNRTHLADYAAAIGPATASLLKVHTSNFRVDGFTAEASLPEPRGLADEHGPPLIADLGDGLLTPDPVLPNEPDIDTALRDGADVVIVSGDKLLGGPQAGLILGRTEAVERIARHPLARAMRTDKLTLAAIEATIAGASNPVHDALHLDPVDLRRRTDRLAEAVGGTVVVHEGRVGGGGAPGVPRPGGRSNCPRSSPNRAPRRPGRRRPRPPGCVPRRPPVRARNLRRCARRCDPGGRRPPRRDRRAADRGQGGPGITETATQTVTNDRLGEGT